MKKIFLIIPVIFFWLNICVKAQTSTWEKVYNGPGLVYDDGKCNSDIYNNRFYYVGGRTWLRCYILKIDSRTGDTIWTKTVGQPSEQGIAEAIVLTSDGGCIFSGYRNYAFSVKLDSSGNIVWDKFYDIKDALINKIIKLTDSNFLMCGQTGFESGLIIKLDREGNLIWSKIHNFATFTRYSSVIEVNQKYFIIGTAQPNDTNKVLFVSLDTSGNITNYKIYKFQDSSCSGQNVISLSDNLVLICGLGSGIHFVKINLKGEVIYEKQINYIRPDYLTNSKYFNGNFYFSSYLISNFNDSLYSKILVTDTMGNQIRYKLFRKYTTFEIYDFFVTDKFNTIITGTISNNGATEDDFYLLRTDSLLNVSVKNNYAIAENFQLRQNYPNPFNPTTKISYSLKKSSAIELNLFDINGRMIKIIENGFKPAGSYEINFSAEGLSSGVYFFSLYSDGILMDTKKGMVMK